MLFQPPAEGFSMKHVESFETLSTALRNRFADIDGLSEAAFLIRLGNLAICLERPCVVGHVEARPRKSRWRRLGWSRGSVVDAGGISYYYKQFPAAGVDVFIALDGMYVGIDMYSDITLGKVMFVKHRSVEIGSYTYDEPSGEKDERLAPFGSVPAIAFSEALGDLAKISGKSGQQQSEGTDA